MTAVFRATDAFLSTSSSFRLPLEAAPATQRLRKGALPFFVTPGALPFFVTPGALPFFMIPGAFRKLL